MRDRPLDSVRQAYAVALVPMAVAKVNGRRGNIHAIDDERGAAFLGLTQAVARYRLDDPDAESLSAWAERRIQGAIVDWHRHIRGGVIHCPRGKGHRPLEIEHLADDPLGRDATDDPVVDRVASRDAFTRMVAHVRDPLDRLILRLIHVEDWNYSEISRVLPLSDSSVRRRLLRAHEKIRARLER